MKMKRSQRDVQLHLSTFATDRFFLALFLFLLFFYLLVSVSFFFTQAVSIFPFLFSSLAGVFTNRSQKGPSCFVD